MGSSHSKKIQKEKIRRILTEQKALIEPQNRRRKDLELSVLSKNVVSLVGRSW